MPDNPKMPFSDDPSVPCAVVVFNLRSAPDVDDARIETLVQLCIKHLFEEAQIRGASMEELLCASQEIVARVTCSPLLAKGDTGAAAQKMVKAMMRITKNRALDCLAGFQPGMARDG